MSEAGCTSDVATETGTATREDEPAVTDLVCNLDLDMQWELALEHRRRLRRRQRERELGRHTQPDVEGASTGAGGTD